MQTWLDRNRGMVFALLSSLALIGAGVFYWNQPSQQPIQVLPPTPTATIQPSPTPELVESPRPELVRVYVSGAVHNSDVYFLPPGSIVKDAIEAAGGFTAKADRARINLAVELQDQQQIHVPRQDAEPELPAIRGGVTTQPGTTLSQPNPQQPATSLVNLNTAGLEALDSLPGIGPAIAQRIIEYRESVGGFTSVQQITQVSGIGNSTFAKIADRVTVD